MEPLTPKERAVYEYLCEKIRRYSYAPSIRDIMNDLNMKSTSTVHGYLNRLEEKGYIQKESGKSRALRLGQNHTERKGTARVPLLGRVQAGQPVLATQSLEGYLDVPLPPSYAPSELFALKVRGESMRDAGILDGDTVVVHKTSTAQNGDIVVALLEEEATVKVFYQEAGHFRLQPRNPDFEPILTKDLLILGKVVMVYRLLP